MSGIKVKLVHAKNSAVPGVNTGDEIEGQAACDERSGTDRFAGFRRQIDQAPFADQ